MNQKLTRLLLLLFIALCCRSISFGQFNGTWDLLTLRYTLSEKWKIVSENQTRSANFFTGYNYYGFRLGGEYNFTPNQTAGVQIGHYRNYQGNGNFEPPVTNNELRVAESFTLRKYFFSLQTEIRFMVEQRFRVGNYANRGRLKLGITIPIIKPSGSRQPFKLGLIIWNEFFESDSSPYFSRNRVSGSFLYRINPKLLLQTGYMLQSDFFSGYHTNHGFVQFGLTAELNRSSKK